MHLTKYKKNRKNISKKTVFLIISLFFFIFFTLLFIIKPTNKIKKLNNMTYGDVLKKINAKKDTNYIDIEKFIIENENIYGTLASLLLAKQYILKNNLEKAFIQLNASLKYTKEENLRNILQLRMSKIKIQQNKNKEAMEIIQKITDNSWKGIIENIKGDIFMHDKNIKLAIEAWEKSKYFEESKTSKEIINMKINEIQAT